MSPARLAYRPVASYAQAHLRLKTDRGRPLERACVQCGDPAREWAYMGGDPDELTERGRAYSLDQSLYAPMCTPCHRRHDRALADGRSIDVCPRGHLWSENEGIRVKRTGSTGLRFCRACNNEGARRWRQRNLERRAAYAREYRARIKALSEPISLFPVTSELDREQAAS